MSPSSQKISAQDPWVNVLQGAVDAIEQRQPHQYIVKEKSGVFKLTPSPGSELGAKKLRLEDIVDISKKAVEKLDQDFCTGFVPMSPEQFTNYKKRVSELTEKLIDARVEKRKHNTLRNTARIFSFLGSFVLIGLPFFIALKHGDKEFAADIQRMRDNLKDKASSPQPSALPTLSLDEDE